MACLRISRKRIEPFKNYSFYDFFKSMNKKRINKTVLINVFKITCLKNSYLNIYSFN